jgi:SagB-type dehydrogenase family enzyme
VAPIALEVLPLSTHEVDYPLIRQIRASSMLRTDAEVRTWREGFAGSPAAPPMGRAHPLESVGESEAGLAPLAEVIVRRGSTRRFARTAIGFRQLSTILDRTTRGIPADFLAGPGTSLIDAYLIVNAVDGLPSGAYYYARPRRALELLRPGAFRREAGYLCLEQALGADASVVVFFLTDLARLLERYGNRGYGAAQLEAGIVGGKMYLAAYALGLGATGTTFYDDDVTAFFAPHARGKSVLFTLALGRAAKAPGRVRLLQPGER